MSDLASVFKFEAHDIRTLAINGDPWFVASDICGVLDVSNTSQAVSYLDNDEFQRVPAALISSEGRPQDTFLVVNEPGMYSLVLRSRKPQAKAFKRWVTHEVIPAIRKTGRYEDTRSDIAPLPQTFAQALRLAADQQEQIERQAAQIEADAPKVAYVDNFLRSNDACLVRQLAKRIGYTEADLREELLNRKVIFRVPIWRFSESKQRDVREWRYEATTAYMHWFRECDQPNAPRHHNNQMRTTLYVTPAGKVGIARLLGRLNSSRLAIEGAAA